MPRARALMTTGALVHFADPIPDEHRAVVLETVREIEPLDVRSRQVQALLGAPWVVTCRAINGLNLFMAQRTDVPRVLTAKSADGLAKKIRSLADDVAGESAKLFQLAYDSRAVHPMSKADLQELLEEARTRNKKLHVTGLLLYKNKRFFQILEGPEVAVRIIFRSILADERHENIRTLLTCPIDDRTFPEWRMGFISAEGETPDPGEPQTSNYLIGQGLQIRCPLFANVANALTTFREDTPQPESG